MWCVQVKIYVKQVLSAFCYVYEYENDCLYQCKPTCIWKHHRWDQQGRYLSDRMPYQSIQWPIGEDDGAQIFYSIRSQTKSIGIGVNCENPSQSLPYIMTPMTRTYDWALIPLVGLCALLIHPMTNWWRMRGYKSFIAFDRRPSPLVLE